MSGEKGGGEPPGTPPKDLRCGHNDGKGWQCKRWKLEGKQYCQQHHMSRSNGSNNKDEEIKERVLDDKSNNKITEKQVEEEEIMGSRWGLRPRKEFKFAKIAGNDEEEDGQPFFVPMRRKNVGKKRNKDGQAGKPVKACIKAAINFVSPENVNECISLAQEFRKLPQNHRAKQDKLEVASRESGAKASDDEYMEMAESSEPSDADAMQKAPFNADFGVFDTSFSASKGDVVSEKSIVEGVTDTHFGSSEVSGIDIAPEYRILYDNLCKKFGRIDVDTKVPYLRQTYAALTHGLLRGVSVMMSADKSGLSLVAVDEWISIVEFAKSARFNVEWLSSPLLKMREFVTGGRMELCRKGEALATAIGTEAEVTRQLAQARKIVSDLENQLYSAEASRKSLDLEVAYLRGKGVI